jgi:hypothetical protein
VLALFKAFACDFVMGLSFFDMGICCHVFVVARFAIKLRFVWTLAVMCMTSGRSGMLARNLASRCFVGFYLVLYSLYWILI